MTFEQLNLRPELLRAVAEAGYTMPSPIQAKAIRPVAEGHDLMGCAQTGTGKTAAFALPILQRLSENPPRKKGAIRALILTPTRELALQIGESFAAYGKYLRLRHTVIFGGVGQAPQVAALQKGVEILIACPGRLNDLIGQGYIDLSCLEIFVLDEADRMLDMGFVHDVKKVIAKLPKERQNLMFSATMPREIEELAGGILRQPVFVKVDPPSSTVERIGQSLYFVEKGNKKNLLPYLINTLEPPVENALVFSRTKHGADKIARDLTKQGIPAAAIHGNKSQNARVAALEGFKAGKTRVLVATDIAARGIDINELAYVFNYDLPEVPETYVHRIGRTARAGADGMAVSFCAPEEQEYLAGIEKLNRKKIPVMAQHPWAGVAAEKTVVPVLVKKEQKTVAKENRAAGEKREKKPVAMPVPAVKSEVQEMEVNEKNPAGGSHRRGRGGRGRNGGAQVNQPQAQQQKQPAKQQPARNGQNGQQKAFDPRFLSGSPAVQQPNGGQNAKSAPQKAQQPAVKQAKGQQKQQPKAAQPAKQQPVKAAPAAKQAAKPAPQPRRGGAQKAEDPGLVLISRRAPQQKFASFEEYMQAHGGVTAPIEDYAQE